MKIVYIGPFVEGVELEDGQWAEPGEPVEVDSDMGDRLLDQVDNFARPTTKAAKAVKKAATEPARATEAAEEEPSDG